MSEWTHVFESFRAYRGTEYGKGAWIKVKAGLHYIQGNSRPYFSVGAEIYFPRRRDCEACGCLHDEVLKHWPALEPVIALHLSTDQGAPMHAIENGLSHLGFGRWSRLNFQWAANHFRITREQAADIRAAIVDHETGKHDPRAYSRIISGMIDRWQSEADEAVALLDSLAA